MLTLKLFAKKDSYILNCSLIIKFTGKLTDKHKIHLLAKVMMPKIVLNKKHVILHGSWLILAIAAGCFYQTRLYTDAAYYLFHCINKANFHVELNRYVLALSQVFPLLAVKLQLSLKAILIWASVGHVLFHYLIFCVITYNLKQPKVAVAILLNQIIGLSSGYFTPQFELYYSVTLLVFIYAYLQQPISSFIQYFYLVVVALMALLGHPLANLLLLFMLGVDALQNGTKKWKPYLLLLGLMVTTSIFKSYTATAYEIGKSNAFMDTLKQATYDVHYLSQLHVFLYTYYADLLLLLLASLGLLLYSKRFLHALFLLLGFVFMLAMANISSYGFEHTRYQEQVYFPLVVLVTFVFATQVLALQIKHKTILISLLVLICIVVRLLVFIPESNRFVARIALMKTHIAHAHKYNLTKVIITPEMGTAPNGIETNWSYSMESLLLSSIAPKTVSICTTEDLDFAQNKNINPNQFILRRWDVFADNELNNKYFNLPDSNYVALPKE